MKSFSEFIVEISDDKLKDYSYRAADDIKGVRGDESPAASKKRAKRYTGMQRAAARLRRESVAEALNLTVHEKTADGYKKRFTASARDHAEVKTKIGALQTHINKGASRNSHHVQVHDTSTGEVTSHRLVKEDEERAKDSLSVMRGAMSRADFLKKHYGGKNGSYASEKKNEPSRQADTRRKAA